MHSVDFLVIPLNGTQLQPRHTTKTIGTRRRTHRRTTLDRIRLRKHVPEIRVGRDEVEQRDASGGEFVVAAHALLGAGGGGDGVVECEFGDVGEDVGGEAGGVAGGVEEGGDCAGGFGGVEGGGGGAGVVLCAPADGDVAECEAGGDGGEGGGGDWENDVGEITEGVCLCELGEDSSGYVLAGEDVGY